MSFPKVLDVYDFCTEELKKSLDLGREFERKIREEEDARRLQGLEDAEMKDESKEEEKKQAVGKQLKDLKKEEEAKINDQILYRPHGQGLDTGNY